jgi:hypothetical protein
MAEKQEELGVKGKGVEPPSIKSIDKAADEYQTAKDRRCRESPREVAAKGKLQELLHKNREALPKNEDGNPFYRYDGRDYCLAEKMTVKRVPGVDDDED